jgi:hypothetical protein
MIRFLTEKTRDAISAKLGRCPRCWRLSFRGALIGWIGAGLIHFLIPDARIWYVVLLWPVSFSVLWLAHIATFGLRVVAAERRRRTDSSRDHLGAGNEPRASRAPEIAPTIGRREMLQRFSRSAAWAILVSAAIPILSACSRGGGGSVPTSNPNSFVPGTPCPCPANTYWCEAITGVTVPAGCTAGCSHNAPSPDCQDAMDCVPCCPNGKTPPNGAVSLSAC